MGAGAARRQKASALPSDQPLTLNIANIGAGKSVTLQIAGNATVDQLLVQVREQLQCTIDIEIQLVYDGSVLQPGSLAALGVQDGSNITVVKQDAKPLVTNNAELGFIVSRALAEANHPLTRDGAFSLVRNSLYSPIAQDSVYRQDKHSEFDLNVLMKEPFPGLGNVRKVDLQDLHMQELLEDRGRIGSVALLGDPAVGDSFTVKNYNKAAYFKHKIVQRLVQERLCFLLGGSSSFVASFHCALNLEKSIAFCLEPLSGGNLATTYRKFDLFGNVNLARFCCASASLALEHLHSVRVAVRQIVPQSLTFDHRGHLKLTDLGCAKIIVTRTYTLCGTAGYMPPEHIQNKGHTCAVDPWNLGVFLFELLSDKTPFDGPEDLGDTFSIMMKTVKGIDSIEFPESIGEAEPLVKSLMRANPSERLSMGSDGWCEFQAHKYFTSFDFEALRTGSMPSPYMPSGDRRSDPINEEELEALPEEAVPIFEAHFGAVLADIPCL